MTRTYIALGSNLGDRGAQIKEALRHLAALPQTSLIGAATVRETPPENTPPGSGPFLNTVAALDTELSPTGLLAHLLRIEREMGRDRSETGIDQVRNGPRLIDLDLILYGQERLETPGLTIPHPRMHERRFVLEPLAELAPKALNPLTKRTASEMLQTLTNQKPKSSTMNPAIQVIHTITEFRKYRESVRTKHASIVPFVPTMGALHEGHASLVRQARTMAGENGTVLASIFVNPTQFAPGEDFAKYPRTLDADVRMLAEAGCDAVFVPSAREMYGESGTSGNMTVDPGPMGSVLEGAIRPGHFAGVCTVVAKLLHIVEPTHLLLGQKDFQQQAILRKMCGDLNMGTTVVTCETIREADGLAMSSRNRYLNAEERPRAASIFTALSWAKDRYTHGQHDPAVLEKGMRTRIEERGLTVQYAVIADAATLDLWTDLTAQRRSGKCVLLVAAKLGATRLIDNLLLDA